MGKSIEYISDFMAGYFKLIRAHHKDEDSILSLNWVVGIALSNVVVVVFGQTQTWSTHSLTFALKSTKIYSIRMC